MEKTIRILCVFSTLDCGGAETMCMNIYRNIDRTKVQFDFVKHTNKPCVYDEEIRALGGRIYEVCPYRVYNHIEYCIWWHNHFKKHPEHRVIHGHFATVASVYLGIANKYGCVTIAHSHFTFGRSSVDSISRFFKWKIMKQTERIAKVCFACSKEAGEWIYPHRKYYVINNAVDAEKFAFNINIRTEIKEEWGLIDKFVVGTVGTIKEVKNPYGTIKIFKEIYERNKKSVLLWIGDGPMRLEIEERLRIEGIDKNVILSGVRTDVNRLMQAMDVFILPSYSEGLPVVLVEAQASGLPCFVSDVVTKEVDITGLCNFMPVNQYSKWAESVLSVKNEREDKSTDIRRAKYDIKETTRRLQNYYLKANKAERR